jgi:hypothetical protein
MTEPVLPPDLKLLFARTTSVLLLLTVGYYAVPFRLQSGSGVGRLVVSLVVLALLVQVLRRQLRTSRQVLAEAYFRIQWLLTALYLLVLGFALLYSTIATVDPGQFDGVEDRTDALYLSVTIVATVGFGDIHPQGTVGQLAATVHMLFNLVYLGTALRLLSFRPAA